MSEPADPRARRMRTAGVLTALAGLVVLAVSLPWSSPGRAAAGDPAQLAQDPAAASCQQDDPQDTRAAISQLMQDVKERKAAANPDAGSEYVVLNNRGYNYGPPPEVEIDPFLGPRVPAEPADSSEPAEPQSR